MTIKEFIAYLISNKGFVVIGGVLHRNGTAREGKKETCPYHVSDIGYKWHRYNKDTALTAIKLQKVLLGLDISIRKPAEQARLLAELKTIKEL